MRGPIALAGALALLAACSPDAQADRQGTEQADTDASCTPGAPAAASEAGLQQVQLCIRSGGKALPLTVELAQTPEEQARGLMFRTELADDKGMLFPFPRERVASFWMKNTVIPLDLIFIRRDGSIESIAANAVPYDESPRASGEPVIAVLELAGGRAAALGIEPGDTVRWAANER